MTEPTQVSPAPPAAPVADWARFETAKPEAPAPQYLTTDQINAYTDHAALSGALREGRVGWMNRPAALDKLAALLTAAPAATVPASQTPVQHRTDLPDPSILPPTDAEAARMNELERSAFTDPPKLASDYHIPGDGVVGPELQEINDAIRASLYAAQIPPAIGNIVLTAASAIAPQLEVLDDAGRAMRRDLVQQQLRERWGADYDARSRAVSDYLGVLAVKAAAAGQPMLQEILTDVPDLLQDVNTLEALWNAARLSTHIDSIASDARTR